jgi:hypothetical protein
VYKLTRESAERLRSALLMETVRIRAEKNKQAGQPEGKPAPVVLPPRRPGRPSNLERAGATTGQQSLNWHGQPAVATVEDAMEE